jgi:hypothetical protein
MPILKKKTDSIRYFYYTRIQKGSRVFPVRGSNLWRAMMVFLLLFLVSKITLLFRPYFDKQI